MSHTYQRPVLFMKKIVLLLLCFTLISCATSPTGRSQLLMMPDNELNEMGLQAFNQLKTNNKISTDSQHNKLVTCIAQAITAETGGDWEVVVFSDETLNAFALPGNKIGVHTGLILLVDSPDELAAVIGHEVGHVIAHHSNERMSQKTALKRSVALIAAVSQPSSTMGKLALGSLGVGAQYGIILPFSRTHESEADIIGLDLMAKAGFDPRKSISLWQKMAAASQGQQSAEFMSTHPSHDTRIKELSEHMPTAMKFYQQAQSIGKKPGCSQ